MKPINKQSELELRKLYLISAQDLVASLDCFRLIHQRVAELPDMHKGAIHRAIEDIARKTDDALLDLRAALKKNIGPLRMAEGLPKTPDELLAKRYGRAVEE